MQGHNFGLRNVGNATMLTGIAEIYPKKTMHHY